jgi:hypothetical protein
LEPLSLFELRLYPQVGGARQNAFCERQDAFDVEFFDLAGVTVDPSEREFLAQFLGVALARGRTGRRRSAARSRRVFPECRTRVRLAKSAPRQVEADIVASVNAVVSGKPPCRLDPVP